MRGKAKEPIPITTEEIAQVRDELDLYQAIDVSGEEPYSRGGKHWYRARVIEKYRDFFVCEYRIKGRRITESFKYAQLICGDEFVLV